VRFFLVLGERQYEFPGPMNENDGMFAYRVLAKQPPERDSGLGSYDEQLTAKCLPQLGGGAA
jgi:hypothetical protein